jgi:hypothetical protein
MSCLPLKLQSVTHIGYDGLTNIIESNLKIYYDWALLSVGAWSEVDIPSSGAYGGDYSKLRLVDDPSYSLGQVWEAPRKDFVWETGINYENTTGSIIDPQPVGVPQVNSAPTTQPYHINYPQGKVIFDNPQPTNADIHLQYSYRYIQIYLADNAPWWKELQFNSHRVDSTQFAQLGSGEWSLFGEHRVQLPAVVIESVPRGTSKGWELGSSSKEVSRNILFHFFAETSYERNNLMDIFSLQNDRKIVLFDTNAVSLAQDFPLNYRGELLTNNHYSNLKDTYGWRKCFMHDAAIVGIAQLAPSLYNFAVKTTMEVIT